MCDRLIVLAGLYLFISGISTKISLLNSINQGDSYGYDTQCYITNFLKDSRNASNWSEESSDDAIVTFKLFRYDPNGYKLISTSESEIKKGIIYALQWKNDNIIAKDFQRNLTLSFDGKTVNFAIGKWVEKSTMGETSAKWDGCQTASESGDLEYYDYTTIRTNGKLDWMSYKYDVTARSSGPRAPSYDNTCVPPHNFGTKDKVINIRHLGEIWNSDWPWEYSNDNYTIPKGQDLVLHFQAEKCSDDHNFQGCKVQPRNLTLWVDEDEQVQMAMAQLDQSFTVTKYGSDASEEWICADVGNNDDGSMELTFVSSTVYSQISNTFVGEYDTIYVKDSANDNGAFLVAPFLMFLLKVFL